MTGQKTTASTTALLLIITVAAGLALTACGRKAPLDRPALSGAPQAQAEVQQPDADANRLSGVIGGSRNSSADVPPAEPNRRFFLDPLLD